jgi:hypothetical protein
MTVQRYGKKRAYAILNQHKALSKRFLHKMCQLVYEEHVPILDVILLFSHISALNENIGNINSLSYAGLKKVYRWRKVTSKTI